MCFYDQHHFTCGDWKWGHFRQHCAKEYRIGETCGMKLIMQTVQVGSKCKLCEKVHTKMRRRAAEADRITQWQREGRRFQASIHKSMDTIRILDGEIDELSCERDRRLERDHGLGWPASIQSRIIPTEKHESGNTGPHDQQLHSPPSATNQPATPIPWYQAVRNFIKPSRRVHDLGKFPGFEDLIHQYGGPPMPMVSSPEPEPTRPLKENTIVLTRKPQLAQENKPPHKKIIYTISSDCTADARTQEKAKCLAALSRRSHVFDHGGCKTLHKHAAHGHHSSFARVVVKSIPDSSSNGVRHAEKQDTWKNLRKPRPSFTDNLFKPSSRLSPETGYRSDTHYRDPAIAVDPFAKSHLSNHTNRVNHPLALDSKSASIGSREIPKKQATKVKHRPELPSNKPFTSPDKIARPGVERAYLKRKFDDVAMSTDKSPHDASQKEKWFALEGKKPKFKDFRKI